MWGNHNLILHIDADLIIVNKPAGLRVIRDGYDPDIPYLSQILSAEHGPVWVVHRLDKLTSGVVILARSEHAHRHLNTQFQNRQVQKLYFAIVHGEIDEAEQTITSPLLVNGDRRHRTVVNPFKGKPAETKIKTFLATSTFSFLEIIPKTGYTHQIRAHLSSIQHPILGDPLYSPKHLRKFAANHPLFLDREPFLYLHAFQISFTHPNTGQIISCQAPLPSHFKDAVEFISRGEGNY